MVTMEDSQPHVGHVAVHVCGGVGIESEGRRQCPAQSDQRVVLEVGLLSLREEAMEPLPDDADGAKGSV